MCSGSKRLLLFVGAAAASCLAACSSALGNLLDTGCSDELRVQVAPGDTTLAVGGHFTAHVSLTTCGGRVPVAASFTWSVQDSTVARVNSLSGVVTAIAPGSSRVVATATGSSLGQFPAGTVTVRQ